jgi:hypothetical protein
MEGCGVAEPKWTPGPWVWWPKTGILATESRDGRWIVSGELSSANAEANARLIAAAPELYEALKGIIGWCPTDNQRSIAAFDKALAALAKARGE